MSIQIISQVELVQKLHAHRANGDGRVFSAGFTTKEGNDRVSNGRFNVTKHLKGGKPAYDRKAAGVMCYYDTNSKGYRSINLAGLKWLRIDGEVYQTA